MRIDYIHQTRTRVTRRTLSARHIYHHPYTRFEICARDREGTRGLRKSSAERK